MQNPKANLAIETNFWNNLINQRWRLGTFASLLGCFIVLSFLTYQYQSPNLSPIEIIKSIATPTASMEAPAPTVTVTETTVASATAPTPIPTTTLLTASAPAPTMTITKSNEVVNNSVDIINKPQSVPNTTFPSLVDASYEKLSMNESKKVCNIFDGEWVYDPKGSPFYQNRQCPFLSDQVSCRRNGRPEFEYENWRWEAKDCQIPRWNGKEILERLRGKRVIIAGDSLNRNHWESLSCLLYSSISPRRAYVNVESGVYKIFKAMDYNCTVEFFWSPFLVELDDQKRDRDRILKLDRLAPSANKWKGADIMVFNTGFWWTHTGKMQAWDLYEHQGKLVKDMDVEVALQIALKTWANWIDLNVDPSKTSVFFRSISATHHGKQWCFNQTQPIKDDSYVTPFPRSIIGKIVKTIGEMQTPIKYLNITKLSEYRKDAHPTIYTTKGGKLLTMEQRAKPEVYGDCNHWCLPGVPDTWNSLLFASHFNSYPNIL